MEKYTHLINRIKKQVDGVQKMVESHETSDAGKRIESFDAQPKAMKIFAIVVIAIILISFIGINIWLFH
jgi:DNA-binding FrmR family transcriptional regulator